jgi:hypothetical protein
MIKSLKQVGKKVRKKALLGIDEHEFNTFMELLFRMRGNLCGGNNNKLSGRQR